MKKDQIKKNLYYRVKLRPITKRFNNDTEIERFDDDWVIESILDEGVRIKNTRSDYTTILGYDHIHSYMSDPNRNYDELKHGVLVLNVQLCIDISRRKVSFEPTERPGKAHDATPVTRKEEVQKIIDEYYAALKSKKYFKGIEGKGICALAIIPEVSSIKLDLSNLPSNFVTLFQPIYCSGLSSEITGRSRFTFGRLPKGYFGSEGTDHVPYAATEVTELGEVKAYNSSMLENRNGEHKLLKYCVGYVPNVAYEREIIIAFHRYLTSLKELGVSVPFFIHTAMLNVNGYIMGIDPMLSGGRIFQDEDIRPPLHRISNDRYFATKQEVAKTLRPMFDYIWREFGYDRSVNYSEADEWISER
jgi:hypothetical protein